MLLDNVHRLHYFFAEMSLFVGFSLPGIDYLITIIRANLIMLEGPNSLMIVTSIASEF